MPQTNNARVSALDLLRSLAIVMVLVAHFPKTSHGLLVRAVNYGFVGVDLFFVLSGYLIANQWFKLLEPGERPSLAAFYVRRWFRTLPAYYAVLLVYFLLNAPRPDTKFLFFAQNIGLPNTFTQSWSLCVEEQFYLVFPIVTLALVANGSRRLAAWTVPSVLLGEIVIRGLIWSVLRPGQFAEPQAVDTYLSGIYDPTYCRLDGIALGVGLAQLKHFAPSAWRRLLQQPNLLLAGSSVALALSVALFWRRYSPACATVGFSAVSLSFALLTAASLSPSCPLARWRVPGAGALASLSYSLYLTHMLAMDASTRLLEQVHVPLGSKLGVMTAAPMMLLFAAALFFGVERPGMALRDRLLRSPVFLKSRRSALPSPEAAELGVNA